MHTIRNLFFVTAALVLAGCSKILNKPDGVASLDISNAIYLGIDESVDFDSDQGNNLIKITSEDQLADPEVAQFIDKDGNFLKDPFVKAESWNIISASKDFSILDGEYIFKIKGEEMRSLNLLVNNKTGALYDLMGVYRPDANNEYMGSSYYQTDKNGNIYYRSGGIHRIIVADPENISVESYVDYAAGVTEDPYFVSKDGDVYFARGRRVKSHLGGILETNMEIVCFEGLDGKTYGFQNEIPNGLNVLELNIEAGELNVEVLKKSDFYFESGIEGTILYNDTLNERQLFMVPILFPEYEIDFENHHLLGFVLDQNSWSQSPILVDFYLLDECRGMEGAYIWFTTHTEKFLAFNLESITINPANNQAGVEEILEFELPSNFQMGSVNYDIKAPGIHFSAYDLQTEKSYRCSFTVKNGFEYFEDTTPKIYSLTRLQ